MVKKISCRVISSKPLINRSEVSLHIKKPNNTHHRVDNKAARTPQVNYTRNLFTYSHSLDMVKECINTGLIGQFLDCYA